MIAGSYRAEQELHPVNFSKTKINLLESNQIYKSVTNPNGKVCLLHLFQYQNPIVEGPDDEIRYDVDYVVHDVSQDDTLEGLALQYSVSKSAIQSSNNITSDDIFYYKQLKIPQRHMISPPKYRSVENSPAKLLSDSMGALLPNRHQSEKITIKGDNDLLGEVLSSSKDNGINFLLSAKQDQDNLPFRRFDSTPFQNRALN